MENPAVLKDVKDSIERPLTSEEERVIPNWLGRAWRELNRVVPGISARNALPEKLPSGLPNPDHLATDDVRDVVVAMVERKVRNPDARRDWRGDDFAETIDSSISSGQIYVSDQERAKLMPAAVNYGGDGMFSIPLTVH